MITECLKLGGNSMELTLDQSLPKTVKSLLDAAVQLRENGEYEQAIDLLKEGITQFPGNSYLLTLLSHCCILNNQPDAAGAYLSEAKTLGSANASVGWNEVRLLLKKKNVVEALRLAKQTHDNFPDDVEGMAVLGSCLRANNDFSESLTFLNKAIDLQPNYAEAYINRGLTYLAQSNKVEALTDLEKAHKIKPHIKQIWHLVVGLYAESERYPEAILILIDMIGIDPNYEKSFDLLIACNQKADDSALAVKSFTKIMEVKPGNASMHVNLGIALKKEGKADDAIANFAKALAIKPDYAEAYNNMGNVLQEQGKLEEAIEAYNKALALKPDNADAYINMGNALKEQGKLEEAIEACNKALALKPDYAEAYNNMGNVLQEQGKAEEAIKAYNKTLSLKPNFAEAATNLAILLFQGRYFEEAAELFSKDNSIKNQSYLLKCLYELDEQSKFYNKLDYLVERGENNCVIGSFTSRAEIRYGIKKNNPFCNDPFKYVLKTDLTKECDFKKIFVENAANILRNDDVKHKSQDHLTNGIQTAGNIFTQVGSVTNLWQDIIHSELKKYKDHFCKSEEGLIRGWPADYSIYGWLISMKSGGELSAHIHDTGWITGSIYINVPPKSKKDSGNLVVTTDDTKPEKDKTKNRKSIDVVTGSLCLFPSSLLHYTIPFDADENRIVLAFDVIPK
jgi:tetratricopeptide (TPR) repeat protein